MPTSVVQEFSGLRKKHIVQIYKASMLQLARIHKKIVVPANKASNEKFYTVISLHMNTLDLLTKMMVAFIF